MNTIPPNQNPPNQNPAVQRSAISSWLNEHRTQILVILIGSIITAVIGPIIVPVVINWLTPETVMPRYPSQTSVSVRVADSTSSPIRGAKVLLFFPGGSLEQLSDANGIAHFNDSFPYQDKLTLIVEADEYESDNKILSLPLNEVVQVQLNEQESKSSSIIVRVVDDNSGQPLDGAEVLLLVEGETYTQYADSNGIVKLTLPFVNGYLNAKINISKNGHETQHQNITLLPGKVQDVRLTSTGEIIPGPLVAPSGTPGSELGPVEPTEISIIYAPEEEAYMVDAIEQFNQAYEDGNNPLTGESLAEDERRIRVTGTAGSSGEVAQDIANAIGNQHCPQWPSQETLTPTIYSPSVHHWLALVNYCTDKDVFDLSEGGSPATARAPVVIAIWKSRLEAIKAKNEGEPVGWKELLEVLNSPNGWADYGIESDRQTVYYGHTDPEISSTALSTLIAEFYAIAYPNGEHPILKLDKVKDDNVQEGVRDIEQLIRHYAPRTTEFTNYIAQGPDYLDFVALEENDLIKINRGETGITPPEDLVALYPKEGTFWHDHPFAIPNADWVNDEQREAAKLFTEFVRSETVQQKVLASGFRPVIELDATSSTEPSINPIVPDLGVDPNQSPEEQSLRVPKPEVIAAIQDYWLNVKKQADVILMIDTSKSMVENGDKLIQAQEAARIFLENMSNTSRVGLIDFGSEVKVLEPNLNQSEKLQPIESRRDDLITQVENLKPDGDTALYDAIAQGVDILKKSRDSENERIQAVIVLSDGQDTTSETKFQELLTLIKEELDNDSPIIIIPVAYGYEPQQTNHLDCNDLGNSPEFAQALQCIAQASTTLVQFGNPESIEKLLLILSGYF